MLTPHVRLNLARLVRQLHALPGVNAYLVCSGCDRASLWRWRGPGPWPQLHALIRLDALPPDTCRPEDQAPYDPSLLLVLPVHWVRGLVSEQAAVCLGELASGGWQWLGLQQLPVDAEEVESCLGRLWQRYRRLEDQASNPAELIERLRVERLLGCCFAPGSLARLRCSWSLAAWLDPLPREPDQLAADLPALLQLLPAPDQALLAEAIAEHITEALDRQDEDPIPWLRLLEALVGGINSRDARLEAVAESLRPLGLQRAVALPDPAARGLVLMRLLQVTEPAPDVELACLATAIDALVLAILRSSARGERLERRQLQRQLEAILRASGPNLLLLRALVPLLAPDTCYRLPFLQPPSVCLQLLKGALLLDSRTVAALGEEQRKALVALVERILPRIWWQQPQLRSLLHALRRFRLDLAWLRREGLLLSGLELLHSRGIPPLPQDEPGPTLLDQPPLDSPDPNLLLRTQVRLLLRLRPHPDERAGLLRLAQSAGKPPLLRLLDGEDEEAPAVAVAAGLAPRSVALTRLVAERRGVPELLPPFLPPAPVEQTFGRILFHWRSRFGAEAGRERAPIAVVITTRSPRLALLRLALESLALQTLWPQQVWLVDDGSPSGIAEQLATLVAWSRRDLGLPLRLLRRHDNQGQYVCRNLALAAMTAKVLAIQDDDDLSHPLRLASQWQALQRGCAAVYGRHLRLDQHNGAPQVDGDGGDFFGDGVTTLMVERSTARDLGGFYPVRSRGDVEFRCRLEQRYGVAQVVRLEQPLYLMRGATNSISSGFEYGCSLALPSWRRLMDREVLV